MPGPITLDSIVPKPASSAAPKAAPAPAPAPKEGFLSGLFHKAESLVGITPKAAAPAPKGTPPVSLDSIVPRPKGSVAPVAPVAPAKEGFISKAERTIGDLFHHDTPAPVKLDAISPKPNLPIPGPGTPFDLPTPDIGGTQTSTPQTTDSGTVDFIKETARAFPRDAAAVGAAVGQAGVNLLASPRAKEYVESAAGAISPAAGAAARAKLGTGPVISPESAANAAEVGAEIPTDTSWWTRFIFGKDSIKGLPQQTVDYETALKSSGFAKAHGLDHFATPFALIGATAPVSLDFLGMGGEEGVIKALAKADTADAAKILRSLGVHESLILPAAEHIGALTDHEAIRAELNSVEALQKTTHAIPASAAGVEEETTKGAEAVVRGEGDTVAPSPEPVAKAAPAVAEDLTGASTDRIPDRFQVKDSPVKPTRALSAIEHELDDMVQQESFLNDAVSDHSGRALMKFRSRETGLLPEVARSGKFDKAGNQKPAAGKFARSGDGIVQDLLGQDESNGGDLTVAQQKLDDYVKLRDQHQETVTYIKQLRAELRNAKAYDQQQARFSRAEAAASAKRSRQAGRVQDQAQPRDTRGMTREERKSGSVADILQRGAEVVRDGKIHNTKGIVTGNASIMSQRNAALESVAGGIESGPFKGFSSTMRNWFQDWIFARQSVDVDSKVALKKFEILKHKAGESTEQAQKRLFDWLSAFYGRKGKDGVQGQVESMLDRWLREEQAAGIKVADKHDYIPIYLKDADGLDEGALPADRRVGLKPGFAMQSQFKDYFEARDAGYLPKFDNMYDILAQRARAHFKAMADATFFRDGASHGWIVPENAIDQELKGDFKHLDSERFPAQSAMYGNTVYRGVFAAPDRVAEKINAYLRNPDTTLQKVSEVAGSLKGVALSVGIPNLSALPGLKTIAAHSPEIVKDLLQSGSGFVVHFWNVLPREVAADIAISKFKAPYEIAKYFYYGLNPRAAQRFIDRNLAKGAILARNGMKITTEDQGFHVLADAPTTKIGKLGAGGKATADYMHHLFGENYFQRILPARKIENGLKVMESYKKLGFSEKDAARQAAQDMNIVYGGINWESLGRSRNWQAFYRSAILAPDYLETNVKQGANIIKAFLHPKSVGGRLYRGMMAAYAGSYLVANIINHENSGHWMWENDILHQFSIDMGKDPENGKTRYLNIYGTGVEFLRIPLYTITAIAKGNLDALHSIALNRLSVPFATVGSLVMNVDWKGDPIFGPDKYSRPQTGMQAASNAFDNTVGRVFPGSVTDIKSMAAGKLSTDVGVPKAFGLPTTEKSTAPSPADVNKLKSKAADDVKKGDYRLLNQLVKAGVIAPRSKAKFIQQARSGPTVRQAAQKAKTAAKAKAARENVGLMNL